MKREIEEIASLIREHLLGSEARRYILKIVIFGSWAKGLANQDSDIDVLIVKGDGKEADDSINMAIYETMIDTGLPIEALICPVEDILWTEDYFLYNILSYGKEVFTMDKETLKEEAVQGLLGLSKEYLSSSEEVARLGHWRLAIDAAYNSLELIGKALLLKRLDDLPGSHGGIIGKFGEIFVKGGEVDPSIGRGFNRALQLRNWARYKWGVRIGREEYQEIHNLVKCLDEVAKRILKGPG